MNQKKKILLAIFIIAMASILFMPNISKAALQSNGNEPITANLTEWMYYIRRMQETGGTLGLNDTINEDFTSNNTNLDIHMEKNTEYGALAILSASSYGNPEKITGVEDQTNGVKYKTTTGNKTGVYMTINAEWVAAAPSNSADWSIYTSVGRYKNLYEVEYVEKAGDAVWPMGEWHGGADLEWLRCDSAKWCDGTSGVHASGLLRSSSGSIFSFYGYGIGTTNQNWKCGDLWNSSDSYVKQWMPTRGACITDAHVSRAVVVVGSGI